MSTIDFPIFALLPALHIFLGRYLEDEADDSYVLLIGRGERTVLVGENCVLNRLQRRTLQLSLSWSDCSGSTHFLTILQALTLSFLNWDCAGLGLCTKFLAIVCMLGQGQRPSDFLPARPKIRISSSLPSNIII